MSKAKKIGIGLMLTAGVLANTPRQCTGSRAKDKILTYIDGFLNSFEDDDTAQFNLKRPHMAEKVYHRFEEIPEITDEMALAYRQSEYTYIINADIYRQTGKIKLKRVLKDEITKSNVLSVMYRAECADYNPKQDEDQIVRYDLDLQIISSTGIYKGPSQMNDQTINDFIKYLALNPQYRQYIKPMLQTKDNSPVAQNTYKLERMFYTSSGNFRSLNERNKAFLSQTYQNLTIKTDAWQSLSSPRIKKVIAQKEAEIHKKLSGMAKNYLYLTEKIPEEQMITEIESFNLNFYPLGRVAKPQKIITALANSLHLKDSDGKLDASRVPTYAIGAAISHINWKGNGTAALSSAMKKFPKDQELAEKKLKETVKTWVNGKGRRYGIDEQAELNMITPEIISQYKQMELPGAEKLDQQYKQAVRNANRKVRLLAQKYKEKKNNLLAVSGIARFKDFQQRS